MKIRELRTQQKDQLQKMLREKRSRADDLRFGLRQKKIKNVKEYSGVKKDIARILTLIGRA